MNNICSQFRVLQIGDLTAFFFSTYGRFLLDSGLNRTSALGENPINFPSHFLVGKANVEATSLWVFFLLQIPLRGISFSLPKGERRLFFRSKGACYGSQFRVQRFAFIATKSCEKCKSTWVGMLRCDRVCSLLR